MCAPKQCVSLEPVGSVHILALRQLGLGDWNTLTYTRGGGGGGGGGGEERRNITHVQNSEAKV